MSMFSKSTEDTPSRKRDQPENNTPSPNTERPSSRRQTITPVYVQSDASVTLTCPADDQATTLTWTGPGGNLYVTGTTVEAGLSDGIKSRISAGHSGGNYTLTFTELQVRDTGIFTCTLDGTVGLRMVIVQGGRSASSVYVRRGGAITLNCPNADGTAQWSVTSPSVFIYTIGTDINPTIPISLRTRLTVDIHNGTYSLGISDVQLSDVREYRCTIGVTVTFYHLLLYIPPVFPEIENTFAVNGQNRTRVTEDGSLTLSCNARGGFPVANVSWIKNNVYLAINDSIAKYTKVVTRADDRTMYRCQSSSPALTSPQTTSVLVYLDLKPGEPEIPEQVSQIENNNLQVVCTSTGSRPPANIQWNIGRKWLSSNSTDVMEPDSSTETYTVTSTLSLLVTRHNNGESVYCRASNRALPAGIESVTRTLTVLYRADINVSGKNTTYTSSKRLLTCAPDGNPNIYKFGRWKHTAEDGSEIRQLTGSSNSTHSVLTLPDPGVPRRYEDTGYYICIATNNVPDSSFSTSGSVFFVVEAPPLVITNATVIKEQLGNNATIEVDFYSRPTVHPNDIKWTRNPNGLPPPVRALTSIVDR
ncbi:cell adhesion molecule 2-like [Pecten maximus]|uniref:cell adhesion molecule 2-like n=1 Tax=Pecten maximus TaxID=6579 RepID=UPI001458EBED|nr:cell adhesion molecule 2-like [Pecten maximus]